MARHCNIHKDTRSRTHIHTNMRARTQLEVAVQSFKSKFKEISIHLFFDHQSNLKFPQMKRRRKKLHKLESRFRKLQNVCSKMYPHSSWK